MNNRLEIYCLFHLANGIEKNLLPQILQNLFSILLETRQRIRHSTKMISSNQTITGILSASQRIELCDSLI